MSIITPSLTKFNLRMKFFNQLLSKSLKRDHFDTLITGLAESLKSDSIISPFKSCAELLKVYGLNPKDTSYTEAFTALKKLGIILKHDNRYLLNPLVEDKATSKRYELAIQYYNILLKDIAFEFKTLDELKNEAVSLHMADLQQLNQRIEDANYIFQTTGEGKETSLIQLKSFEEYYDIAFCTPKPSSLYGPCKAILKRVNEIYRNVSTDYVTELLLEHIYMLEQQGIVSVEWAGRGSKTKYNFNKLTLKLQRILIPYSETQHYLDSLPTPDQELAHQLFSDNQNELQYEFEEEDFTATLQVDDAATQANPLPSNQLQDDFKEFEEWKPKPKEPKKSNFLTKEKLLAESKLHQELLNVSHKHQYGSDISIPSIKPQDLPTTHPDYLPF